MWLAAGLIGCAAFVEQVGQLVLAGQLIEFVLAVQAVVMRILQRLEPFALRP
jgi:hypothetical protein